MNKEARQADLSAILPNGESFAFWEKDCHYDKVLHVDCGAMSISLAPRTDAPMHAPGPARPVTVERDPSRVRKTAGIPEVPCDYAGQPRGAENLPGPFAAWERVSLQH